MTSPTNTRSRRAALKAILTAREVEAAELRAVVNSGASTAEAKDHALAGLAALSKDTLLRLAEIDEGLDVSVERSTEAPALAPPMEVPATVRRPERAPGDSSEAA